MQSLLCLQPFVFFVGQISPATTPSSAVLQGNSSKEELHFPELLVQLSFCAAGERQHKMYIWEGTEIAAAGSACLLQQVCHLATSSRKISGPVLPLV